MERVKLVMRREGMEIEDEEGGIGMGMGKGDRWNVEDADVRGL